MHEDTAQRAIAACNAAENWHRRALERIGSLDAAFQRMETTPRLDAPWAHFTRGLREHFAVEESRVFPAIRALARGQAPERDDFAGPLHDLRFELDEIRILSDALSNAAPDAGPHEAALLELLDELDEHARREERELFPLAMALLSSSADAEAPTAAPVPELRQPTGALEALLTRRRNTSVRVITRDEAAPSKRAEGLLVALVQPGEEPASLSELSPSIAEIVLAVDDPAQPRVRDALKALADAARPVTLLVRDANQAGLAYALALRPENAHVRELFVIGDQPPEQLATAFGAGPASVHPESIRALSVVLTALRDAFRAPRVEDWHWAVARLPGGVVTAGELFDLSALAGAARLYLDHAAQHPHRAKASLLAALVQHASGPDAARLLAGLVRQQALSRAARRPRDTLLIVTFARGN